MMLLRILSLAAVLGGFAIIFPDVRFVGVLLIAAGYGLFMLARSLDEDEEKEGEDADQYPDNEDVAKDDPVSDVEDERWVTPKAESDNASSCRHAIMKPSLVERNRCFSFFPNFSC